MITLKKGDTGSFVQRMQEVLNLGADGVFGEATENAVKAIQKANNLVADGVAGQKTLALLKLDFSYHRWGGDNKSIVWALPSPSIGLSGYSVERGGADQFGTKKTIESLVALGKAYFAQSKKVIQVGDISRLGGGLFPPHSSHRDGRAVDIRPARRDNKMLPVTCLDPVAYSRTETARIILLTKKLFPETVIFFNDEILITEGLTIKVKGHYNHLHIQF